VSVFKFSLGGNLRGNISRQLSHRFVLKMWATIRIGLTLLGHLVGVAKLALIRLLSGYFPVFWRKHYDQGWHEISMIYTMSKKKRCHWFFCCNFYKYWRIFIIFVHNFTRVCQSIGIKICHHTFVMLLPYRVKVSDTKVTHFTPILALCTCLYRLHLRKPVSMKQTKHSRKSEA